jgi:hypothetical protein
MKAPFGISNSNKNVQTMSTRGARQNREDHVQNTRKTPKSLI